MTIDPQLLSADYIAAQQQRLLELRAELRAETLASPHQAAALETDEVARLPSLADDVLRSNEADNQDAVTDHTRARLAQVERALLKIEEGNYGLSDRSGQPIPKARLDALPESLWNVEEGGDEAQPD